VAMVISLGGVAMISKPSFLFGGKGINKLGLVLALMQVSIKHLLSLLEGIVHQMHLLRTLFTKRMR